jgi:hypothetical protein
LRPAVDQLAPLARRLARSRRLFEDAVAARDATQLAPDVPTDEVAKRVN